MAMWKVWRLQCNVCHREINTASWDYDLMENCPCNRGFLMEMDTKVPVLTIKHSAKRVRHKPYRIPDVTATIDRYTIMDDLNS